MLGRGGFVVFLILCQHFHFISHNPEGEPVREAGTGEGVSNCSGIKWLLVDTPIGCPMKSPWQRHSWALRKDEAAEQGFGHCIPCTRRCSPHSRYKAPRPLAGFRRDLFPLSGLLLSSATYNLHDHSHSQLCHLICFQHWALNILKNYLKIFNRMEKYVNVYKNMARSLTFLKKQNVWTWMPPGDRSVKYDKEQYFLV